MLRPAHRAVLFFCLLAAWLLPPRVAFAQMDASARLGQLQAQDRPGRRSSQLGNEFHNLASQLRGAGRVADAELPARRALAIWQEVHGPASDQAANASNTLAAILNDIDKSAEAERHARRALEIWESVHGLESGAAANALNTLVSVLRTRGRWQDAEPLARRVLAIWAKTNGQDSDAVAIAGNTLADVLLHNGKAEEAEAHARTTLRIWQKVHGADSDFIVNARNTLAAALDARGKKDEALREQRWVLDAQARKHGPRSGPVALFANNLAWVALGAGRVDEAEELFRRALDIWSSDDARVNKPSTAVALSGLARAALMRGNWRDAYDYAGRTVAIAVAQSRLKTTEGDRTRASYSPSEITQASGNIELAIRSAYRVADGDRAGYDAVARDAFINAQRRIGSQAADAVSAMAGRVAKDPALIPVIRQRQDLEARWQALDKSLESARNVPAGQRNREAEKKLALACDAIGRELAALDARIGRDFSHYSAIARPEPLGLDEIRGLLKPDEALLVVLPMRPEMTVGEETFIWVVTRTDFRWVRSSAGAPTLERQVATLRCGLDYDGSWLAGNAQCKALTGIDYTAADDRAGVPLPFMQEPAHELYKSLFAGIEDLTRGKHLLVVASGALTRLPLHVLLTAPPRTGAFGDAAWLVRSNPITVLPAVSSLKALRRDARASAAPQPFIGFGDPQLAGSSGCGAVAVPQSCPDDKAVVGATTHTLTRSFRAASPTQSYFTDGLADLAKVRQLCPLPDTVRELECVAQSVAADAGSIVLGAAMTETAVKAAKLDRYRIVHFATHGLLAGEMAMLSRARAEPALVMTPPQVATALDDGLLTASEIAGLKLDADWVVLSACNTAGSGEADAEALSGMVRAFFYAGARALLVSHWPVDSYAAALLTSRTFAELRRHDDIGRSEALRRAMLALIDDKERPWAAHPSIWAPFVVIGEGGVPVRR